MIDTISLMHSCDLIAEASAKHIRVTHALQRGQVERATDLLAGRMSNIIASRLMEGDDQGILNPHIDRLTQVPGPLLSRTLSDACRREIERLRHA